MRAGDWWNRIRGVKLDVYSYNIIRVINQKSDVKSDESVLGKAYNGYIISIFYYYYSYDPYI